ncbi:ephexin isoform X6 [Rhynchophorus ferrugineus]
MTTVNWQNAIAFDTSTVILELPYAEVALYPVLTDIQSNKSFLHSAGLNKSTLQLKRAFLEQSINDQQPEDVQMDEKSLMVIQSEHKRPAPKKISFKIKKQSSLHKRNFSVPRITNIPTNKVAELTKKFNEMVENQTMSREQVKMLVKRVDSVCGDPEKVKRTLTVGMHRDSSKVARKPSVKTKPTLEGKNLVIIRTKPGRKSSMKKEHNDKLTVRVKTTNTEPEETIPRPTTLNINKSLNIPNAIIETSPNGTSVREAIEIFERKSSPPVKPKPTEIPVQKAPTKVKPEIPEKSPILISLKDVSKSASVQNKEIPTDNTTASIENDSKETEEFDEDKVQIINIPAVLPQRRCDSMYETMHLRKISPDPKFKSAENIYKDDSRSSLSIQPNYSFLWRDKSASVPIANSKVPTPEDMKKLPPDIPPKPNVEPIKPPLPPKIIHKNALPSKISKPNCDRKLPDYEEIGAPVSSELPIGSDETFQNYDEITKPVDEVEKSEKIYEEITRPDSAVAFEHYEEIVKEEKIYEELKPVISKPDDGYEPIGSKLTDTVYEDARDENFYETLPVPPMPLRRQKQEPLPPRPPSSTRQEESLYNCYESIYTESKKDGYYESINGSQLTDTESNRDSVLSSDHKSNSLYGKAIPMWDCNSDGAYYKTASDISSDRVSNRSDEWEDMTDNDEEENKFIIVREKQRNKKSGWSQHFREQLSKTSKISIDEFGEEADHYYETLNKGKFDDFESDSFESDIESEISSDKIEFVSVSYDGTSDFDSDNYEDVADKDIAKLSKTRPTAMELVSPKRNSVCFTKTLWCEIPEVINSAVLSTLSAPQKKLQEAKFEILTSEASYLNSLNVLKNHFIKKMSSTNLLTPEELNILFGHVEIVRSSSEKLLHDLEKCWQDNILLHGICDIVQKHAEENFNVYIQYCENQVLFDEVLKVLKDRLGFSEFLSHLELSEVCQSLTLYSFLMLPMQRITRWPLLVEAVLKRLRQQDPEYFACNYALVAINKIVSQCNEAARNKEREVELRKISKKLEFPSNVPITPIFITDRYLVRHGPVCHIQPRNDDNKLTFGKKFVKTTIHLFLFNDLFVVSKEKSEGTFTIVHYCPRNLIELNSSEIIAPGKDLQSKHLIMLTMLENQDRKTVEYLLACNSESDKTRWSEALTPPKSQDPEETLYESWDCPQVSAIHNYTATQSDELSLTKGDVINVLRKLADGWYHGEKIRDGKTGWFPANHTVEIPNIHVRARNLRQRHKFLAFSEHYLKSK